MINDKNTYYVKLPKDTNAEIANLIQINTPVWLPNRDGTVSKFITHTITVSNNGVWYEFISADKNSYERRFENSISNLNYCFFLSEEDALKSFNKKEETKSLNSSDVKISSVTDITTYLKTKGIMVYQYSHPQNQEWSLHWYSNSGEDMNETIYHSNTVGSIVKAIFDLANNFDAEEHAKLYVNSTGENGVPNLKELIEDAYDIKEFLMNIASELTNIAKTNDNQKSPNESKFQIVGIQFPIEEGIYKKDLIELINNCSARYLDTIRIDGEHSSAMFVFDSDIYEEWVTNERIELFIDEIKSILDDKDKESPNEIYQFCGVYFKMLSY